MSLLSIISDPAQGAAVRCGLTPPASLFGSSDPNTPLLIALAQEEGEELCRRHDWQTLQFSFSTVSAGDTGFPLPADFDRFLPNGEIVNQTLQLIHPGPINLVEFRRLLFLGGVGLSPAPWTMTSNVIQFVTAPTAGQTIGYPYVTKNFVRSNIGTAKAVFSADTDTTVIPERLIGLGVIWRWKKDKGFSYAEHMATYERAVELACSRDRGLAPITVSKPRPSNSTGISSTWPGTIIV